MKRKRSNIDIDCDAQFAHKKKQTEELSHLVHSAAEELENVKHKLHHVEHEFREAYPGKCMYLGENEERNPFGWRNKAELATGMDILDKEHFAAVFNAVNAEKGADFYCWLVEFIDLVLVAIVVKIANHVKYRFKDSIKNSDHGNLAQMYMDTLCLYTMLFTAFTSHSFYWIRFTNIPGRLDDFLHLTYGLGLALVGLYVPIRTRIFSNPEGLLMGWLISLFSLGLLYLLGALKSHHNKGSIHSTWRVIATVFSICISFFSFACNSDNSRAITFLVSCLPIIFIELNGIRRSGTSTPSETHEISFRYGIFVFILLGESILSLILTRMEFPKSEDDKSGIDFTEQHSSEALGIVCCSFFIVICIYYMYFNGHMTESGRHALDNAESPGSVVWLFFHWPLGWFLLLLGFGFKQLVYFDYLEAKSSASYVSRAMQYSNIQICISLAAIATLILVIRTGIPC